jgi:hypothetical protein
MVDLGSGLGVTPGQISNGLSAMGFYAQIFAYLLFVGALIFAAMMFMKFRYRVMVFEKRGEGAYRVVKDRAKKTMDRGTTKFVTLKTKLMFPPPGDNRIYMMGKKDFFMVFKNENNIAYPISFQNPSGSLKVVDNDVIDWMIAEFKKSGELYDKQGFWDKYGGFVVQIAFVAVMFVIFLILLNKMDAVAQAFSGIPSRIELVAPGGGVIPPG